MSSTSSAGWARALHAFLTRRGLDANAMFMAAGLDIAALADPRGRFSQEGLNRLWDALVDVTGDPGIGLHVGAEAGPAAFGAVGYVMMTSATLDEAIRHALRFQRFLAEAMRGTLQTSGADAWLLLENVGDRNGARPQAVEAMMTAGLAFARWVMREPVIPLAVSLRHAPVAPLHVYEEVFGCPAAFGAAVNGLLLSGDLLTRPVPSHDPGLLDHHVRLAETLARDSTAALSARVRAWIADVLPFGTPSQAVIADQLHLTPKTLQRRLEQEGTGFKALVEDVRFETARACLARRDLPLQDVASLCGYQDYSAFAKAFRQWSGRSPGEWRDTPT